MDEYSVKVEHISKVIGGKKIIDDISFNLKSGSILGIVGPNGAGKSTLLKIMTGLYPIDNGDVYYNGISLKKDFENAIKNVGCLIESPNLYNNLSGLDNLLLFKRMFDDVDDDRIKEVINIVNLRGSIGKKFKTYSLGMKERLGIASALLNKPDILILDEPTNGLDPIGIKELRNLIKSLEDTTVIISSHLLSEIENICDEVIFIDNGKIIERKELTNENKQYIEFEVDDYPKARLLIGEYCINEQLCLYANDEQVSSINKYLVNNNIKVYGINKKNKSLEQDFFEKIGKNE